LADKEKSAAVREELTKSVAAYRKKLAPLRAEMARLATIGAEEYTRLDLGLIKLGTELAQGAWEARLRALLQSI
jgi:hypothetical protein